MRAGTHMPFPSPRSRRLSRGRPPLTPRGARAVTKVPRLSALSGPAGAGPEDASVPGPQVPEALGNGARLPPERSPSPVPSFSFSQPEPGAENHPRPGEQAAEPGAGPAPGAQNHPRPRQAKGRRSGIPGAGGQAGVSVAPPWAGRNPGGFGVLSSAGVREAADVSPSIPPRSLPPLRLHGSSQPVLRAGPGRARRPPASRRASRRSSGHRPPATPGLHRGAGFSLLSAP